MANLLLTSFARSRELDPLKWVLMSCAVYQPRGFNYPRAATWANGQSLSVWDIRRADGSWVRPRDFINRGAGALQGYCEALSELYVARTPSIEKWLEECDFYAPPGSGIGVALCCWCPYDKAAQRQLKQFGTFVCHTAVIELVLVKHGAQVERDEDRREMVSFLE